MRWSWESFAAGLAGGAALAGLLWLTFGAEPDSIREPRPIDRDPLGGARADTSATDGRRSGAPERVEAPRIAARRHVSPEARTPREDAPPPLDGAVSVAGDRFYTSAVQQLSGRIKVSFSGGENGWIRVISGRSASDPAPALLKWSIERGREIFPEDGPVARSEAALRLQAETYAERAAGLGLATRVVSPPIDLMLDAARDTAYPDLRGAALLAAVQHAVDGDHVVDAVLELALDGDSRVRRTATALLGQFGEAGAQRAAEILLSGDYTSEVLSLLSGPVAAHGDVALFLGASPPPDAALSVVQQLSGRLSDPKSDADRRLATTLPDLVRPLLESPAADESAPQVLPQLAKLGHGAFLRSVATTPLYRSTVRSAAVTAALGDESTRADGIAAAGAILTDPTADVALARGVLGAVQDEWLDDPTLRGALEAAARGHPSAWVRDDARARLARHDPAARGAIVIHEAKYGAGDGWLDVTDVLRGAIANGQLKIQAHNGLAGDPKPGAHKSLRVEYSLGGERRLATAGEGGWLTIP